MLKQKARVCGVDNKGMDRWNTKLQNQGNQGSFAGPGRNAENKTGTSIFDPVLCELIYRWFCVDNGKTLDPFAGGSVRGIVAGYLGYDYTGVELRAEQVEANRKQAEMILQDSRERVKISISSRWANHLFSCSEDYIVNHCHGRCCEGSDKILISLLPDEAKAQEKLGFVVKDGLLLASSDTGKCPHKQANSLCKLHNTLLKPFGCIASPFTLNNGNTLIIRNRYSKMKCHGQGEPAYKTFRASLDLILGKLQSAEVCSHLESGGGDITAYIEPEVYDNIRYLDGLKHNADIKGDKKKPIWITGDSQNIDRLANGEYDLIFSCPPYYDLEIYSDLEGEMSSLPSYGDFIETYRRIVAKCVGMLKDGRFACFVVGDIRDKKGFYRNFVSDTISAFQDAGMLLYNEAILVTAIGSLPIRITRAFQANRKLGKTHQNVLVFYKGDIKKIKENYPKVEVVDLEKAELRKQ